jgi:hypothetical protein
MKEDSFPKVILVNPAPSRSSLIVLISEGLEKEFTERTVFELHPFNENDPDDPNENHKRPNAKAQYPC